MPSSRRNFQRGQTPSFATLGRQRNEGAAVGVEDAEGVAMATLVVQPAHPHIPDLTTDSNLVFEGMVFVYSVMALCLQYINLYRTVWWLPHSNAKYALNFYLIDEHLSLLLVVITSRRLIYCFVNEVCYNAVHSLVLYWALQLVKVVVIAGVMSVFSYTTYRVILRHSLLYSLFLCYPMVVYVILFRHSIKPLFGKSLQVSQSRVTTSSKATSTAGSAPGSPAHSTGTPKHGKLEQLLIVNRDIPLHNCSMSPETVREEVETLKTDFNNRIKQVLFNSMLCAYYMGFVPLCFAENVQNNCENCWNTLYYDAWWVGQHVCLVWCSTFIMFTVHYLPAKYLDVLHRCARHLGNWVKVEGRQSHKPYGAWSELQVWQQGALVKHVRGLFRAEGINNSAEPGNTMHSRFNFMFYSALRVTNWLTLMTAALIVYQFILLLQATEWSHVLSLALLLFSNYYVLFKLLRDRFVLTRAYRDEPAAQTATAS